LIALNVIYLLKKWSWRSFLIAVLAMPVLLGLRFYLVAVVGASIILILPFAAAHDQVVGARFVTFVRQVAIIAGVIILAVWLGFADRVRNVLPQNEADVYELVGKVR